MRLIAKVSYSWRRYKPAHAAHSAAKAPQRGRLPGAAMGDGRMLLDDARIFVLGEPARCGLLNLCSNFFSLVLNFLIFLASQL